MCKARRMESMTLPTLSDPPDKGETRGAGSVSEQKGACRNLEDAAYTERLIKDNHKRMSH